MGTHTTTEPFNLLVRCFFVISNIIIIIITLIFLRFAFSPWNCSIESYSFKMAAPAVTIEELPSPETNILRSKFFMRFQISGGPHMDALLYNQGTIMKLIQDIRLVQSRNIGGVGAALEIEAEVEKPVPQFAEEVSSHSIRSLLVLLAGLFLQDALFLLHRHFFLLTTNQSSFRSKKYSTEKLKQTFSLA